MKICYVHYPISEESFDITKASELAKQLFGEKNYDVVGTHVLLYDPADSSALVAYKKLHFTVRSAWDRPFVFFKVKYANWVKEGEIEVDKD